nr:hypothetical protein [candidate division Zixibacteria bacterium]
MDTARKDYMVEIMNIGIGRACVVLSELVGARVNLTVPEVDIFRAGEIHGQMEIFKDERIISVTENFKGNLQGEAILVLSNYSGLLLTHRLNQYLNDTAEIQSGKRETVTEVGNIVLNSLVGSWSEILNDHFKFGVPEYLECTLSELLDRRIAGSANSGKELYAICANTHFDITEFFIMGTIIALFDKSSVENLFGTKLA